MSILKTTRSEAKLIILTSRQPIIDEIKKLGYTYDCNLLCWSSNIQNMPYLIFLTAPFDNPSVLYRIYIYLDLSISPITFYNITSMSDLFNFIKELKLLCQS